VHREHVPTRTKEKIMNRGLIGTIIGILVIIILVIVILQLT
jgi:tetrahydromethanopterin S-methyltransferase subunit F